MLGAKNRVWMKNYLNVFWRNWTKWYHVAFVETFNSGCSTYELFKRDIGLSQYKKVFVGKHVHGLVNKMNLLDS